MAKLFFLFILISVALHAHAIPINEFRSEIKSADLSAKPVGAKIIPLLKRREKLLNSQQKTAEWKQDGIDLADEFFRSHHFQDAIWTLEALDETTTANLLKRKVVEFTKSRSPKSVTRLSRNTVQADYEGGLRGIFKVKGENDDPQSEIDVYVLSEVLGLRIVPLTFEASVGWNKGSLQLFVPGAKANGKDYRNNEDYETGEAELMALDFISHNKDRNFTNTLVRPGSIVAIDHGLTYRAGERSDWSKFAEPRSFSHRFQTQMRALRSRPDTIQKLASLSDTDLRRRLRKGGVAKETIDFYVEKRSELLYWLGIDSSTIETTKPLHLEEPMSCQMVLEKAFAH